MCDNFHLMEDVGELEAEDGASRSVALENGVSEA